MGVPMTIRERQVFTLPIWFCWLCFFFYVFGTNSLVFCVLYTRYAPHQHPCELLAHKMQDPGCQIALLHSVQPSQAMLAAAYAHKTYLSVGISDRSHHNGMQTVALHLLHEPGHPSCCSSCPCASWQAHFLRSFAVFISAMGHENMPEQD